jgi:gliding motility-associated-like protein
MIHDLQLLFMKNLFSTFFCLAQLLGFIQMYAGPSSQLHFVENARQWNNQVLFKSDLPGGHVFLTKEGFRYSFYDQKDLEKVHEERHHDFYKSYQVPVHCYAYDVQFKNARINCEVKPINQRNFYHNYFLGNDPKKWAGHVGVFEGVQYQQLYEGIDLHVYSVGTSLKYDLIVHPKTKPGQIIMQYKGIQPVLKENGNLMLELGFNQIEESSPYTYQMIDGQKVTVPSRYVLKGDELSFEFPEGYNRNYDLIIDPTLIFATYSTSTATTYGFSATYDLSGSLYAGGECFNTGWPSSVGAFQLIFAGGVDAGINKYTPAGNALIYSTYYGGSGYDLPNNMVVNAANELAMTGSTGSSNLPLTAGAYDNTLGGQSDAYVVRFNATGTALLGATFVGGSNSDAQNTFNLSPNYGDANRGEIYYDGPSDVVVAVSTQSNDFPITAGAFQTTFGGGTQDGCFFKLDGTCSNLIFSTYLGGSNDDACFAVVKNSLGNWVLTGGTESNNFPTTGAGYQIVYQGGTADGFVSILDPGASTMISSTYLGTSDYDHGFKIQVDPNDTVYVCGQTQGAGFPVSAGVYSNPGGGIFIAKLTPSLNNIALSTRIGQTSGLVPTAFLKDNCGNVYFTGFQAQAGLPLTANAYQSTPGGFWLSVLSGDFSNLVYATYMGASGDHVDGGTSRFDPQGIVYHSVCTISGNQYQSPGCLSPNNLSASWDVSSFKFDFELAGVSAALVISPNDSGCAPFTVNFTNFSIAGLSYLWDFGDGGTSTAVSPTYTYLNPGTYTVRLIAYNPSGCVAADTAYTTIRVIESVDATFIATPQLGCIDDTVQFNLTANPIASNVSFAWNFGDGTIGNTIDPSHIYTTQNNYTVTCIASNGFCKDTFQTSFDLKHPIDAQFASLLVDPPNQNIAKDSFCLDQLIRFDAVLSIPQGSLNYQWDMGDGNTLNMTTNFHDYTYAKAGLYTVRLMVTDTLGCVDSIKKNIFVDEKGFADFSISDDSICLGEPIFLRDSLVGLTDHFYWQFGDGNLVYDIHNPIHTYDQASAPAYTVTLTAEYKVCPDQSVTKSVVVQAFPKINLGKDTAICPGLTGMLQLSDPMASNVNQYLWSTGETSSSILINQPGYYWVRVNNGECAMTDSIWIKRDCYLNIPNSFSPNGDGLNDYFLPRELLSSGLTSFKMSIYNRWGEQIFTTTAIDGRGWDGKYNNVPQPQGVFVYVIDASFINNVKKTFKGNVTLMR